VEEKITLGEYVRRLRRRKRLSLQELAEETGVSMSHLSRIENDNALPAADVVVRLADALDGDMDYMLEQADCLPREILERLARRTSQGAGVMRRAAGPAIDEGYAEALIGDLDPEFRRQIGEHFGVTDQDAGALFEAIAQLSHMSPEQRETAISAIALMAKGAGS
jgi:transcriptional regulator with XRE-family HTH domain